MSDFNESAEVLETLVDQRGGFGDERLDLPRVETTYEATSYGDLAEGRRVYLPGLRITDQPPPTTSGQTGPSIQELVRRDLEEREQVGRERYGTSLYPHNGRDPLVDAYQEALDLACYLRQAIEERAR